MMSDNFVACAIYDALLPLAYGKADDEIVELDEAFRVIAGQLGIGVDRVGVVPPMRAGDFRTHVRVGKAWLSAHAIANPADYVAPFNCRCSIDPIGDE